MKKPPIISIILALLWTILLIAGTLPADGARAEGETVHFYILPIIHLPTGARQPKYMAVPRLGIPGINCSYSFRDYGSVDMAVMAANITDADHAILSGYPDVYSLPSNLDVRMSQAERSALSAFLEANGIPGDWITSQDTFRTAFRTITGMMVYFQRVSHLLGYPEDPFVGVDLNTQYRNVPEPLHTALSQAASELGYAWNVASTDQLRKIWKLMADQASSTPILFGMATL